MTFEVGAFHTHTRWRRRAAASGFAFVLAFAFAFAFALPGAATAATLQLEKAPVVLGRTESVVVTVLVDEQADADDRPLRLAVNVGSFSQVVRLAPGRYRTSYTPPSTHFPQVALVALWRETGAEAPIEFLRIPLHGTTRLPVGARRGSKVTVVIGPESFGPVVIDADGKVEVPITVPPGVEFAELHVREPSGNALTKRIPIDVPTYNRLTAGLVPHALVADGTAQARLEVFYDGGEHSLKESRLKVSASVGEVTFQKAEKGRFVYWYRPPAAVSASSVEFTVAIDGDKRSSARARLALGLPQPARVVVRPPQKPLRTDGTSKDSVAVVVLDSEGLGLPGQKLTLTANGVALPGLVYEGNGLYRAVYTAPDAFPPGGLVQFLAACPTAGGEALQGVANYLVSATALPRDAVASLSPSPLPADGRTEAELRLDVRDEAGLPLAGAKLLAVASHGTVGLLTDEGGGRYRATYLAPPQIPDGETLIRIVDATGAFERRVQVPMREDPRRLLLGLRGGAAHSLGDLFGPRAGLDLSAPLRAGGGLLWVSLTASAGQARQRLTDPQGLLSSSSELLFVPLAARLAIELFSSRRVGLQLGAGGGATWARYTTSLTGERVDAWGPSALGFLGLTLAAGPGHFFLEAGYTWAPVSAPSFRVETGGVVAAVGYRLGVL